ncbi:MAG: DnaJ domain-containing protein [Anaerolineae bacterium]|nr:DnaJ domain-containing protein [Anaerolineae bacterium]
MEFKDYYKILDLDKTASTDEVKKAYRKLARKYHPDVNPGDKKAEEKYNQIDEANAVLTDPDKRARYDRLNASWHAHQRSGATGDFDWGPWVSGLDPDGSPVDLKEILSSLNKSRPGGFSDFYEVIFGSPEPAAPTARQGQDYHQEIEISLEEAFKGASRILNIGGRRIKVRIPRGAKTGTKVRVRGEGGATEGDGSRGDLYLDIKVTPHPLYEQVGDDLYAELPVDLYTAILGGEAIVPTFRGKVKLRIPPETQSGRTFRLRGQGMPRLGEPDERGDLYAKVMVKLPENLTPEEIELFEELADIRGL